MDIAEEDRIRLLDIADSIREISAYLGNISYEEFIHEEDLMMAVTSQLLQIGGAASELSDEFKEQNGDVDWDVLRGLQYANYDKELELDLHGIWQIVNTDLPEIMQEVSDLSIRLENQELADDEGINIEELDRRDVFFGAKERKEMDKDEDAWIKKNKKGKQAIIRLPSGQIDKMDIEDENHMEEEFDEVTLFDNLTEEDEPKKEE